MTIPKVSIGMPIYNGEPFIHEAIDSVLSQTFRDFELIISDNCSTDKTEFICKKYAEEDNRILYTRQPQNIGAPSNFEFVLEQARADYFLWMAADDKLHPVFIEKLYEAMLFYPDLILVMSDVLNISHKGEILYTQKLDNIRIADVQKDWSGIRPLFFENPTSNIFFCIYGLFRKSSLRLVKLNYKGTLKYLSQSETPFLAQLSLLGKIASVPEVLKIYRRHSQSSFNVENNKLTKLQLLDNFIRVSWCLILIIFDSKLYLYQKNNLICRVIQSSSKFLITTILKVFFKRKN